MSFSVNRIYGEHPFAEADSWLISYSNTENSDQLERVSSTLVKLGLMKPGSNKGKSLSEKVAQVTTSFFKIGSEFKTLPDGEVSIWCPQMDLLGEIVRVLSDLITVLLISENAEEIRLFIFRIAQLREITERFDSEFFFKDVLSGARDKELFVSLIDPSNRIYQIGNCSKSKWISRSATEDDSHFGSVICHNKISSHFLLSKLGFSVPKQAVVQSSSQLKEAIREIGFPCVLKPYNQERGVGVFINLNSTDAVNRAYEEVKSLGFPIVILQQFVQGESYRITILNEKFSFAIKRSCPVIVGDGVSTAQDLLFSCVKNELNLKAIDNQLINFLRNQGIELNSVLEFGQRVLLTDNFNLSRGGKREEVSETVCPKIIKQCEQISKSLGVKSLGIDIIAKDISVQLSEENGSYIEINSMPQLLRERSTSFLNNLVAELDNKKLYSKVLIHSGGKLSLSKLKHFAGESVLAVPESLIPCVQEFPIERVIVYKSVEEVLLNRKISDVTFLVDANQILSQGLPIRNPDVVRYTPFNRNKNLGPVSEWIQANYDQL